HSIPYLYHTPPNQRTNRCSTTTKSATLNHINSSKINGPETNPLPIAQHRLLAHIYSCATRFVRRRDSMQSACDEPIFDSTFLSQHLRNADLSSYISRPTASIRP